MFFASQRAHSAEQRLQANPLFCIINRDQRPLVRAHRVHSCLVEFTSEKTDLVRWLTLPALGQPLGEQTRLAHATRPVYQQHAHGVVAISPAVTRGQLGLAAHERDHLIARNQIRSRRHPSRQLPLPRTQALAQRRRRRFIDRHVHAQEIKHKRRRNAGPKHAHRVVFVVVGVVLNRLDHERPRHLLQRRHQAERGALHIHPQALALDLEQPSEQLRILLHTTHRGHGRHVDAQRSFVLRTSLAAWAVYVEEPQLFDVLASLIGEREVILRQHTALAQPHDNISPRGAVRSKLGVFMRRLALATLIAIELIEQPIALRRERARTLALPALAPARQRIGRPILRPHLPAGIEIIGSHLVK